MFAGRSKRFSLSLYFFVERFAANLIGKLAPKSIGNQSISLNFTYRNFITCDAHDGNAMRSRKILHIKDF